MKVTNPVITLAELEENYACSGMRDRFRHLCGERLVLTEARARRLGPIFGHSAITWVMVSLIMSPSLYRQAWTRHERIKRRARRREYALTKRYMRGKIPRRDYIRDIRRSERESASEAAVMLWEVMVKEWKRTGRST